MSNLLKKRGKYKPPIGGSSTKKSRTDTFQNASGGISGNYSSDLYVSTWDSDGKKAPKYRKPCPESPHAVKSNTSALQTPIQPTQFMALRSKEQNQNIQTPEFANRIVSDRQFAVVVTEDILWKGTLKGKNSQKPVPTKERFYTCNCGEKNHISYIEADKYQRAYIKLRGSISSGDPDQFVGVCGSQNLFGVLADSNRLTETGHHAFSQALLRKDFNPCDCELGCRNENYIQSHYDWLIQLLGTTPGKNRTCSCCQKEKKAALFNQPDYREIRNQSGREKQKAFLKYSRAKPAVGYWTRCCSCLQRTQKNCPQCDTLNILLRRDRKLENEMKKIDEQLYSSMLHISEQKEKPNQISKQNSNFQDSIIPQRDRLNNVTPVKLFCETQKKLIEFKTIPEYINYIHQNSGSDQDCRTDSAGTIFGKIRQESALQAAIEETQISKLRPQKLFQDKIGEFPSEIKQFCMSSSARVSQLSTPQGSSY